MPPAQTRCAFVWEGHVSTMASFGFRRLLASWPSVAFLHCCGQTGDCRRRLAQGLQRISLAIFEASITNLHTASEVLC